MTTENNTITSDFQLDQLCKQYAQDILGDAKSYDPENWLEYVKDNTHDMCHEWADGCYYVIYHYHALQICANCDVNRGEDFVSGMGTCYNTINDLATAIAYGEVYSRTLEHLENLITAAEEAAEVAA